MQNVEVHILIVESVETCLYLKMDYLGEPWLWQGKCDTFGLSFLGYLRNH